MKVEFSVGQWIAVAAVTLALLTALLGGVVWIIERMDPTREDLEREIRSVSNALTPARDTAGTQRGTTREQMDEVPGWGIHETVAAYLEQSALEVALGAEGRLEGPAAEWFRAEAAEAQFVFIGEEHDVREVPILAGALWRELVPLGYKHVAVEAGPWLGDRLDKFTRFADQQALAHFREATLPRLPNNSVPPISEEDVAFYKLLGSVSGPHRKSAAPLIWGLDAEYRAAPLLERLAALSPRLAQRQAAQSLLEEVGAAERSGDYNTRAFRSAIEQVIQQAGAKPETEVRYILDALRWRITAPQEHTSRDLKKELFLRQYEAAKEEGEPKPRVMFRLGAYHAARGLMHDFGSSTLANFVGELAIAEGSRMLNLAIINCQDTSPGDFPRPCTWEQQRALQPFRSAAVADWTLFDLRGLRAPLRQARLNALQSYPAGWEYWNLVMSFDAVVLLGRSEPSRLAGE
ncbi:MAG: hypothetical protein F4Z04_14275 [Acidobacteria bacterium]|nr:hypothetical protein [Acidobacteriota bacterium]